MVFLSRAPTTFSAAALYLLLVIPFAKGHGYLSSPRSRNFIANQDGANGPGSVGQPPAEYCPHCLNSKGASEICGTGSAQNYDDWLDTRGDEIPWNSQGTYTEGGEIIIESTLSANHAGHIDVFICPQGIASTQDCFLDNPVTFVEDLYDNGPVDDNYPSRAYVGPKVDFKFKYRLPMGIRGSQVMLQWRYVTANSCFPPGYKRDDLGLRDLGWLRSEGMNDCDWPLNWTGDRDSRNPEQFWNCAEITILPATPTNSPSPTGTSTTSVPVISPVPAPVLAPVPAPSPTTTGGGCCHWGGLCAEGWCSESQSNCEGNCNGIFIPSGPSPTPPSPTPPSPTPPTEQMTATTTRYWDCSGGACGCAYLPFGPGTDSEPAHCHSNAMFAAPVNNEYGAKYYGTAAISQALGGGDWMNEGCGKCWKVHGWSNIPGRDSSQTTLVLKGTNYCPPENPLCANGNVHFDISAPGFDVTQYSLSNSCSEREAAEIQGFESCGRWMIDSQNPDVNCECSKFFDPVLRAGCENFYSLMWDNASVDYVEVDCPTELNRLNCWEENGNQYPVGVPEFCASNVDETTIAPITPITSKPTDKPTKSPSISPVKDPSASPVKDPSASPVKEIDNDEYCCSDNLKTCKNDDWCNASEGNCSNCRGKWILPNSDCELAWWDSCKGNPNGCCPPAVCHDFGSWAQCRPI